MLQANSPKKFNFFPEKPGATFLEDNKRGLSNFLQVFSLIIVISDPVSNCNFVFILLIVTKQILSSGVFRS